MALNLETYRAQVAAELAELEAEQKRLKGQQNALNVRLQQNQGKSQLLKQMAATSPEITQNDAK